MGDSIVSSSEEFLTLMNILTSKDPNIILQDDDDDFPSIQNETKRVRFSSEISTSPPPNLSREEVKQLWYDAKSILSFKDQARSMMPTLMKREMKEGYERSKNEEEQRNDSFRGLESCLIERQVYRHRTVQAVISSCRKGMTPGQTATILKRCSKWNKYIALVQARRDYLEVYRPDAVLAGKMPPLNNTPPKFPFSLRRASSGENDTNKRDSNHNKRRVKRRVS